MTEGQRAIADYLVGQANWRSDKAAEYPEDPRNSRCAEGLNEMAGYVRGLPADDERILDLTTLGFRESLFTPYAGNSAEYAISRFRFHDPEEGCNGFLTELVKLMRDDALAFAREQGELPYPNE